MKLCICIVILGSLLSVNGVGQAPQDETNGFENGRGWIAYDNGVKNILLMGIGEGIKSFYLHANRLEGKSSEAAHEQIRKEFDAPNFQINELAKQIEEIYSHPANLNIPIVEVVQVGCAILKGEYSSYEEAERRSLAVQRLTYNSHVPNKH